MPHDPQPSSQMTASISQPSFTEIFRNSWTVLWEHPKRLLFIALVLGLVSLLSDLFVNYLISDLIQIFETYKTQLESGSQPNFDFILVEIAKLEPGPLILGSIFPFLTIFGIALAASRASLGMWDGYAPGPEDLLFALMHYPSALVIGFFVSLYGLALGLMATLAFTPMILSSKLSYPPGSISSFLAGLATIIIAGVIFIKIIWPRLRRYVILHTLTLFELIDGNRKHWWSRIFYTYRQLHNYPAQMNQAFAFVLIVTLGTSIPSSIFTLMAQVAGVPEFLSNLVINVFTDIGLLWLFVAIAGFYRLCLNPARITETEPAENPGEAGSAANT